MNKVFRNDQTFKAKRFWVRSQKLHSLLQSSFGELNIRDAVKCPKTEDPYEWLAVNTVDFFNQCNVIYGNLLGHCTEDTCPLMSAGPKYQYLWADEVVTKPIKCSAPDYMGHLMSWVERQLDNKSIFPVDANQPFTDEFLPTVKNIFKRMFRLYSHTYYNHFSTLETIGADTYLNVSFKHFVFFAEEFNLIEEKELKPLALLISNLHQKENEYHKKAEAQRQIDQEMQRRRQAEEPKKKLPDVIEDQPLSVAYANRTKSNSPTKTETDNQHKKLPEVSPEVPPIRKSSKSSVAQSEHDSNVSFAAYSIAGSKYTSMEADDEYDGFDFDENSHQDAPLNPVSDMRNVENTNERRNASEASKKPETLPAEAHNATKPSEAVFRRPSANSGTRGSLYYSGYELQNKNGIWTMSTVGDVNSVTQLKKLEHYFPSVAILGAHWDSELMIRNFHSSGFTIKCVWASGDPANIKTWATTQGIDHVVNNLEEILSNPAITLIYVGDGALRNASQVLKVLSTKNKSIIVSPMAMNDCKMSPPPKDSESAPFVMHPLRFLPVVQRMHHFLNREDICGEVKYVQIGIHANYREELVECFDDHSSTFESRMKDYMKIMISNMVDLISWLFDDVTSTTATFHQSGNGVGDDLAFVAFKTKNDLSGTLILSFVSAFSPAKFKVEVAGSKGQLNLTDNKIYFSSVPTESADSRVVPKLLMDDRSAESMMQLPLELFSSANLHFLRALKLFMYDIENKATLTPNQLTLMEKVLISRCSIDQGIENSAVTDMILKQRGAKVEELHEEPPETPPKPPPRKSRVFSKIDNATPGRKNSEGVLTMFGFKNE